jgi:hypothetical protein
VPRQSSPSASFYTDGDFASSLVARGKAEYGVRLVTRRFGGHLARTVSSGAACLGIALALVACAQVLGIAGDYGSRPEPAQGGGGHGGHQGGGGMAGGDAGTGGSGCGTVGNVALEKPSAASTSQGGHPPADGNDAFPTTTRWCASAEHVPESWEVDLGQPFAITGTLVTWELPAAYGYYIEVSNDGQLWSEVADKRTNSNTTQVQADPFVATARHVRITIATLPPPIGNVQPWASFFDFQVLACQP